MDGLSNLFPALTYFLMWQLSTPGYGALPRVNNSHIVIPYDHCNVIQVSASAWKNKLNMNVFFIGDGDSEDKLIKLIIVIKLKQIILL